MASITANGGFRIVQFSFEGRRRSLRLGKMSQRMADGFKVKLEHLLAAKLAGHPLDTETAAWLANLGDDMAAKLATIGLIQGRTKKADVVRTTLSKFLSDYIASRTDAMPNTAKNFRATEARLNEFFGADRAIDAITAGDADDWVIWLRGKYADATIGRSIKRARQFFKAAGRKGFVTANPFADIKAPSQENTERQHFIDRETIEAVIAAAPDAEWRLIIALSRYAGLRCPSETLTLRWADIDFEKNRFRATSNKTGVRIVPIFAELRPHLDEVFELAAEGAEFVITRYRQANQNLRTQLLRILNRANVLPWERLFHNLRASRETELMETFPAHVVCKWLGNSPDIAHKHYLQVREADFERAANSGARALQPAVQQPAATVCTGSQPHSFGLENTSVLRSDAENCETLRNDKKLPAGLEPANNLFVREAPLPLGHGSV